MTPSWYSDITSWFKKYDFDEQVMIALFGYCFDKSALHIYLFSPLRNRSPIMLSPLQDPPPLSIIDQIVPVLPDTVELFL